MPTALGWILLVLLALFVLWVAVPPRDERAGTEYRTADGQTITIRARFDGKRATAEVVLQEHTGADLRSVMASAAAEAERHLGQLERGGAWADPAILTRAERARAKVRSLLVRD